MRPPRLLALLPLLTACAAAAPAQPSPPATVVLEPEAPPPPASADAQPPPADAGAPAPQEEIAAEPPGDGGAAGYREARGPSMAGLIQRSVTQSRPRWRRCYLEGLARNPSLAGRVVVKFVIGRQGEVRLAMNSGSNLPDERVVSCVVALFRAMRFPAPESGIVTVTYPLIFEPGALP